MTAHVRVRRSIPASADDVFDLLHDYTRRLEWDTLLQSAVTENDAPPGKGIVAVCTARRSLGGLTFRTRYMTFRRPVVAAVRLESQAGFFDTWGASIRHFPTGPDSSDIEYTMTFSCRPRWAARVVEPVAAAAFRIETGRRLDALAAHFARAKATA